MFSTNQVEKTQVVIYDFSVKKIGDYDLEGEISDVQLSSTNIYTIGPKRINIYNIVAEKKNSMEKINELDISALSLTPIGHHLLLKKETSYLLLDDNFECIMR